MLLLEILAGNPPPLPKKITIQPTKLLTRLRLEAACSAFSKAYEWLSPQEKIACQLKNNKRKYALLQKLAKGLAICDALDIPIKSTNNASAILEYIENVLYERIQSNELRLSNEALQNYSDRFRHQYNLHTQADTLAWLANNHVDEKNYGKLIEKNMLLTLVLEQGNFELLNRDITIQDRAWLLQAQALTLII